MPQCLEIDLLGRYAGEPCTSNPDYRRWWHGILEEHCRNYDIEASCGVTNAIPRWTA
jgi:hypothetical protein